MFAELYFSKDVEINYIVRLAVQYIKWTNECFMYENFALHLYQKIMFWKKNTVILFFPRNSYWLCPRRENLRKSIMFCHAATACLTGSSGFLNNDCFCGCGSVTALKPLPVALGWRLVRRVTWMLLMRTDSASVLVLHCPVSLRFAWPRRLCFLHHRFSSANENSSAFALVYLFPLTERTEAVPL